MNPERLESILCLLDERPFHRCRPSRLAWGAAAILALVIAVYARAACAGELFWHDPQTLDGVASVFSLTHLWTHASGAYQPLSLALLWLERRAFGRSPLPYHCVSALLHALSSVMLWLILRRLSVRGAWLAAALFAVHPVQVQSVAWISQQPHVVCAVLYLLTIWVYLRWARIQPPLPAELASLEPEEAPSSAGYMTALVCGILAILCGPAGVSLPVVLMLLVWWKRGSLSKTEWVRLVPFFAFALGVIAAGVLLHHRAIDPLAVIAPSPSALQRVAIAGRAISLYAIDVLWLYPAQWIHPRWDLGWDFWNILPIVLIAVLAILAWAGRRRWGATPVVCLFIFISLLLPGMVITLGRTAPTDYVADQTAYLAMTVPLSVIAAGLFALAQQLAESRPMSPRAVRAAIGIVAIGVPAAFAVLQSLTFHDADTGFDAALAHAPGNDTARAEYAMYLTDQDPAKAMRVLDQAGPTAAASDLTLLAARARVCAALGRYDEAIADYLLVQRLAPDHPDVRLGLAAGYDAAGVQAMAEGRRDDAFDDYRSALDAYDIARQLNPRDESIDDGIGRVLLHEGRFAESIEPFDAAIHRNSACAAAHVHKAQALFEAALQDRDDAKRKACNDEIAEALRIEPTNLEAYRAAADMQRRFERFAGAESLDRIAIQYHPESFRLWMDLASVQAAQGRQQDAARSFGRAAELNPDSAEAWTGLGFAQSAQNQFKDAVKSFDRALALQSDAAEALRGRGLAQAQLSTGNHKS